MARDDHPWVRIELHGAPGHYDGELVARLDDAVVVNVLEDERTFGGTHVFPHEAIASENPAPHPAMHAMPKMLWETRDRHPRGRSMRAILEAVRPDRLLLVEELGDSEVCWIGFPRVEDDHVILDEVDPNGDRTVSERYPIEGLARVAWGGGYLLALEERQRPGTFAVEHFVAAVRHFIGAVEAGAQAQRLRRPLAQLQLRALDLPEWESEAHDDAGFAAARLPATLPELMYWDVPHPSATSPAAPVAISLADDLACIWADLTAGLAMHDAGHRGAACAHWRRSHRERWGARLAGASRALHGSAE